MKWITGFIAVLLSVAVVATAVLEKPRLRQVKQPERRISLFSSHYFRSSYPSTRGSYYHGHARYRYGSTSYSRSSNKIKDKGTNYCSSKHPCKKCYGDCDDDHDCEGDLVCYHRNHPYKSVPGCSGGSSARSKTDFCVDKKHGSGSKTSSTSKRTPTKSSTDTKTKSSDTSTNKIKDKGTNYCTSKHPCKECYGDCDDDHDCKGDLVCYHRDKSYQSVPGCSGGAHAKSKTDFCVDKKYSSDDTTKTKTKTPSKDTPTKSSTDTKTKSSDTSTNKIKDKGPNYCTSKHPCKECYGDCDDDHDCKGDLICYHREKSYQSVPGCSGGTHAKSKTDFCVDKKYSESTDTKSESTDTKDTPTKSSSTDTKTKSSDDSTSKIKDKGPNYCTSNHPCKECYGDCDDDHDCKGDLICYRRDKYYQSVPGCSGGSSAKSKTDFCVDKKYSSSSEDTKTGSATKSKSSDDHESVSYGGRDHCSERHPCERCEGDCDSDKQCKGDLICYHRDSKDKYVPGCKGEEHYDADFCIRFKDKHHHELA